MKSQVTVTLETHLIERIDRERGRIPRSAAIEEIILNAYSSGGKNIATNQQ